MAGAMRRMGIYLGLVEDDDARGYGRYDARQSDHPDADRRYGRYEDDHYDDYAEGDYPAGYVDDKTALDRLVKVKAVLLPPPRPPRCAC